LNVGTSISKNEYKLPFLASKIEKIKTPIYPNKKITIL